MVARADTGRHVDRLLLGLTDTNAPEGCEARQIEWIEDLFTGTEKPELAAGIMEHIIADAPALKRGRGQSRRGRKLEKPGLHVEVCWAPEDRPTRSEATKAATSALDCLGWNQREYYAVLIAQRIDERLVVHAAVCRVNTRTGNSLQLYMPLRRLSHWAAQYERDHRLAQLPLRQELVDARKRWRRTKPGSAERESAGKEINELQTQYEKPPGGREHQWNVIQWQ